jgi:hypothetical protein
LAKEGKAGRCPDPQRGSGPFDPMSFAFAISFISSAAADRKISTAIQIAEHECDLGENNYATFY